MVETGFRERAVMCESKERDWSRVTPRSLIWVVRGTVVPETLTELSVESVFSLWLVPSKRASDLDGLRESQLCENHACRSERQEHNRDTGIQHVITGEMFEYKL